MSRTTVAALLIGWLLGIATAFAVPTLVYQRQSLYAVTPASGELRSAVNDGWIVVRKDEWIYTLERPRFRIP